MRPLKTVELPPDLMLKRIISVQQAADLKGVSKATYERNYPHTIKKISKRRNGVAVGDAINAKPA